MEEEQQDDETLLRRAILFPIVKKSDMEEETSQEVIEMIVSAYEKYSNEYDKAANFIRESLDKRLGPPWHVIFGEGFGFDVSYAKESFLHVYIAGFLGVTVWKS